MYLYISSLSLAFGVLTHTARSRNCILSRFLRGRAPPTSAPPGGLAAPPAPTPWGPVRATARSRSTTCFARPAQTRRPRFVAMMYVVMSCMCYVSANMGDRCEASFLFFTRRIPCNSRQLGQGLGAWATTAGNTNGGVEAWYIAPKILLGICMGV